MSKLNEIEAASEDLPPEDKRQLIVFLAARLRAGGSSLPEPRDFSTEQVRGWVAEDEADLRRFQAGK
jgi:hypothetical protein